MKKSLLLLILSLMVSTAQSAYFGVFDNGFQDLKNGYRLSEPPHRAWYWGDFSDLRHLRPERSHLVHGDQFTGELVTDRLLHRILKTATGSRLCSDITQGFGYITNRMFGFSGRYSIEKNNLCPDLKTGRVLPMKGLHEKFQASDIFDLTSSRQYTFILHDQDETSFESWTNKFNQTFILVNKKNLNDEYLLRVLAHEIAISTDANSSLEILKGKLEKMAQKDRHCAVKSAALHPLIRYSMNALRAFKIENQILQELNFPAEEIPSDLSCVGRLAFILPSMAALVDVVPEEMQNYKNEMRNQCGVGPISLEPILQALQDERVGTQSLCEFLSVRGENLFQLRDSSSGPRPRIGSGTGDLTKVFVMMPQVVTQKPDLFLKSIENLNPNLKMKIMIPEVKLESR